MKKIKKLIIFILVAAAIVALISSGALELFKKPQKILVVGADLSEEQKQTVLSYLNDDLENVKEIKLTSADTHKYLDSVMTADEIGEKEYNCVFIEPTNSGGIHVRTVNITTVTSDMIRNALVTSGITNANIICVSPVEVSGAGSLAGIFKAYEKNTKTKLDDDKVEIATNELLQTFELSKVLGDSDTVELMAKLKQELVGSGLNETEIAQKVKEYIADTNITLTEEQTNSLIQLMIDMSHKDYSVDDVKNAYQNTKDTVETVKTTAEKAKEGFDKLTEFFTIMWQKLGGVYQEVEVNNSDIPSILENTNDSVFGPEVIITDTDYDNKEISEENNEQVEETEELENTEEITSETEEVTEEVIMETEVTETETEVVTEEEQSEDTDIIKLLDYVTYDIQLGIQNDSSEKQGNTLFDITN